MNVYEVSIEPKAISGTGIGHVVADRTLVVVTNTAREAMSIASGKISDKEEISGVSEIAKGVVVDYSASQGLYP